ncbi:MAG TPA: hypothetical protein H9811_06885 [Candidatus Gemmiger excrementigallinarum]|uniref:Uncharacterized protein n=1 Tax=Candidatus Gemmiger excrementigallinarum TaxID=2838609 RepID=A0A9D2ERN3_9FIRM|nr:hypothetical protein [Candidatus Gemmiger excrementigallinarum]
MEEKEIKETLEKQLKLLSERSQNAVEKELEGLSEAMVDIAKLLICL